MADPQDELDAIDVTVTSPDGRIEGRMRSLNKVAFRFLHDSYEKYYRHKAAELLAYQFERGAMLLSAAYMKARREIMRRHGFERYTEGRPPYARRHREYLERGAKLVAEGSTADGRIKVRTRAMAEFKVRIDPVIPKRCDQAEFLQLANGAMIALNQEYRRVHSELRHELYLKYKDRER